MTLLRAAVLTMIVAAVALTAADAPIASRFRADSGLVLMRLTVTDRSGRTVGALSRENFRVFEDGAEQPIAFVSSEEAAIAAGVVLDASNSMAGLLPAARAAIDEFTAQATDADEAFLDIVHERTRLALPLTSNLDVLRARAIVEGPHGRTGLLDAVFLALTRIRDNGPRHKALLILSDGIDNASRFTQREVLTLAKESDVAIYAIVYFHAAVDEPDDLVGADGRNLLAELTAATGGRLLSASDAADSRAAARRISDEVHRQYVLGYYSRGPESGKYHRVRIRAARSGEERLSVQTRSGYSGPVL